MFAELFNFFLLTGLFLFSIDAVHKYLYYYFYLYRRVVSAFKEAFPMIYIQ